MAGFTIEDLNEQEKVLLQRRDAYVEEANRNIASFNGAIQQVQAMRQLLEARGKSEEGDSAPGDAVE